MTAITFYEKPRCANNARQKLLLTNAGYAIDARNLLTTAWTHEELRAFFGDLPVAHWFNRAAPRVKSGEIAPEKMGERTALALMLADPLLIRRPLMELDGKRIVGFDTERVERWLGTSLAARAQDGLQICSRDAKYKP